MKTPRVLAILNRKKEVFETLVNLDKKKLTNENLDEKWKKIYSDRLKSSKRHLKEFNYAIKKLS